MLEMETPAPNHHHHDTHTGETCTYTSSGLGIMLQDQHCCAHFWEPTQSMNVASNHSTKLVLAQLFFTEHHKGPSNPFTTELTATSQRVPPGTRCKQ